MKHLLIIYHSKAGKNKLMADAVKRGACNDEITSVEVRFLRAQDAGEDDLLWADGLIFGTPENIGYMSGALKDFFDRTFYEVEGQVDGKPFGIFIGAGNDGQGALASIRRICNGYNFKEVTEPIIVIGEMTNQQQILCEELGMTLAAGIEAGIF